MSILFVAFIAKAGKSISEKLKKKSEINHEVQVSTRRF